MTYVLEFPPAIEQAIQEKAARRGVEVDAFLREVVEREVETPAPDRVLELIEEQRAYIAENPLQGWIHSVERLHSDVDSAVDAGRQKRLTPEEAVQILHDARTEEDREFDLGMGIVLSDEAYEN